MADTANFYSPLQFAPLYSRDTVDGYGSVVTQNGALTSMLMKQLVFANNALQKQLVEPHATNANNSDSQGVIEIYDAYTLFENLLLNPPTSAYGPNPNTTSYCGDCPTGATCAPCPDPSPYFYADRKLQNTYHWHSSQRLLIDVERFQLYTRRRRPVNCWRKIWRII